MGNWKIQTEVKTAKSQLNSVIADHKTERHVIRMLTETTRRV